MAEKLSREDFVTQEVAKLRDKHGRVDAHIIIRAAKNPKHPFHSEFNWDLRKAAYQNWVDTANKLLRYVTIVTVTKNQKVVSPFYVRDPSKKGNEPGMIAITSDLIDRRNAEAIMISELEACERAIKRARGIVGTLDKHHRGLEERLEKALREIIEMRTELAA